MAFTACFPRRGQTLGRLGEGLALVAAPLLLLLAAPGNAWAVQAHGGSEGLVAHQLGHVLFFIGMGYLCYRIRRFRQQGPGWVYFRAFLWLLMLWNVQTFVGHWMSEYVAPQQFIRDDGHIVAFRLESIWDGLYYLTRLDHAVLIPAFVCLLLALQSWRRQV